MGCCCLRYKTRERLLEILFAKTTFVSSRLLPQTTRSWGNEFPDPTKSWTITLLQWIEERPLSNALKNGNFKAAINARPPIYRCPSQPDVPIDETGMRTSHYTLEMSKSRPWVTVVDANGNSSRTLKWDRYFGIRDRVRNFEGRDTLAWHIGPITEPLKDVESTKGPHAGLFNRQP